MKTVHHPLLEGAPGARLELLSLHFGTPGTGPKVAIQACLHADEIPAMLVAHHLRQQLQALEAAGRLTGEVVLVPAANPIGLQQRLLQSPQGRFEFGSGENFNRHYADLTEGALARLGGAAAALGEDVTQNVARVRQALREAAAALPAATTLASLRKTLLGLAIDADIVLDLHCDNDAVMHLYTATPVWPRVEPLARLLGARTVLLAEESGDHPFDEACSMVWPQLAARLGGPERLPPSCVAVTVELRGETDVDHGLAEADARALIDYLATQGVVSGPAPVLPPALCEATPLAGCMPVTAPHAGVLAWRQAPGGRVAAGELLGDLIEPMSGLVTELRSPVDGVFFARELRRFTLAGASVAKVAGATALRSGKLLSE